MKIAKCPKCGKPHAIQKVYFGDQSKCKDCRAINESDKAFIHDEHSYSKT